MTATTNPKNLRQYKIRFSLIAQHIQAFVSHSNMVREAKNISPNSKKIIWQCFTLLNIFIWIVLDSWNISILSLNSKQFHQNLYSDSFYIA